MIRALSLLWTLLLAVIVTVISFFYLRGESRGFPLTFAGGSLEQIQERGLEFNWLLVFLDILFWWLIFSMVWIILKNYIFET